MQPSKKVKTTVDIDFNTFKAAIPAILEHLPQEWRGTTYKNNNLLGREQFAENLINLIKNKSTNFNTQDLTDLGNAEDYLRVSSNVSSTLETALAVKAQRDISRVFSFSSTVMPYLSLALNYPRQVQVYVGQENSPFNEKQTKFLQNLHVRLSVHTELPATSEENLVVSVLESDLQNSAVDAVILEDVLYINNTDRINPKDILTVRKRTTTPYTTPAALASLQELAGVSVTENQEKATEAGINEFLSHLQTMSGTGSDSANYPVVCTAGLPAISSFWLSLLQKGGANIVMASTAYGGSSQLTDVLTGRFSEHLKKHTFDITGTNPIKEAVKFTLDNLAAQPDQLQPYTVLFIETPTNPDMKVPVISELVELAQNYRKSSGKEILFLVDTTFAPQSEILKKIGDIDSTIPAFAFISLSKSVSRGFTTGGTIVANKTDVAHDLLSVMRQTANAIDATARPDQFLVLSQTHQETEVRNAKAYTNARQAGEALQQAVKQYCNGADMELRFPNKEQAELGFTSSTYSFNLPPLQNGTAEQNAGLAQKFVDNLVSHNDFKPCVSFGQDNNLVYATVPATSTQGAIRLEDKAKQAVGGVQLVRLSFPPTCDIAHVSESLTNAVKLCYA